MQLRRGLLAQAQHALLRLGIRADVVEVVAPVFPQLIPGKACGEFQPRESPAQAAFSAMDAPIQIDQAATVMGMGLCGVEAMVNHCVTARSPAKADRLLARSASSSKRRGWGSSR